MAGPRQSGDEGALLLRLALAREDRHHTATPNPWLVRWGSEAAAELVPARQIRVTSTWQVVS